MRLNVKKTILYLILFISVILTIGPFYWMVVGATNISGDVLRIPPKFIPGTHLIDNFKNLTAEINIFRSLLNSTIVTVIYTFIAGLVSAAAGYAFAKFKFKGDNLLFSVILLSMMVPYQALVIPQFELFANMNLLNSFTSVILPQIAYPFAIFLMRQNMQSIPDSLLEAARIDGCGELKIFFKIILPTSIPSIAAVSIFLFTHQWNNFLWPLITLSSKDMYTLPVALATLAGMEHIDYGMLMLGATISVLPIFIAFLFFQKFFISGMLGGSVKE